MGIMLKFSLDDWSSPNNLLSSFSFSRSRPTTQDSSKEVSFPLLGSFRFSSFTIRPRSDFALYRRCNSMVIPSILGDNL
ncbi:hypothetical protein HanXRQr2_Chr13g0618701 [Helianthus annuus]|uniref:Uncharacterized protein n=1 Tax=Helianthus annuus TaxID=4232 RepID=A0A9K3ELJ3_HELAN|nr:hypothetical protein HanXRQr2_Chr13g0618701 [Helianthus annuus]